VRYGRGHWAGLEATYMMGETLFPVCAPDYPMLVDGHLSLEGLAHCTLIHDVSMASDDLFPTWELWLEREGVKLKNSAHGLKINNSAAVLQAAMERQGVALARSVMVRDDLEAGRLVRPLAKRNSEQSLSQAYYVVHRPQENDSSTVCAFRDWLLSEAESCQLES
jgi:LysR family transcriptional regulator, glycine cleavage system transcriptional activator